MKENKPIIIVSLVVVLIIAGLMVSYFYFSKDDDTVDLVNQTPNNQTSEEDKDESDLSPNTERTDEVSGQPSIMDPFSGPIKLKGVLLSSGKSVAIVNNNNASYVVEVGDIIADYWTVENIENEEVLLKSGEQKLVLKISGN